MKLHFGQDFLRGDLARYARRFDFVELRGERARLPRVATLRRWRRTLGESFTVSLVLPQELAALSRDEHDEAALAAFRAARDALGARWLVIRSPGSATPGARTRRRLDALVRALRGPVSQEESAPEPAEAGASAPAPVIAWEPQGLWEARDAAHVAAELGVTLVRDLSREDAAPGERIYTRIRALGRQGPLAAEHVAERLAGCAEAFVVVEGGRVGQFRRAVLEELRDLGEPVEGQAADELAEDFADLDASADGEPWTEADGVP